MFAIKPILAVDGGKIVPLEKVRSAAKAIARLEEIAAADAASRPDGLVRLAVHHFGNPAEAEGAGGQAGRRPARLSAAQISSLPAVLAAHAGLGVLAVIVGESAPASRGDDAAFHIGRAWPVTGGFVSLALESMSRRDAGARQGARHARDRLQSTLGEGTGLLSDGGGKVFEYDGGAHVGSAGPARGIRWCGRGRHGRVARRSGGGSACPWPC